MLLHTGYVACGKYTRVADRLQVVVDTDKSFGVERQPGIAQPCRTSGTGHPHHLIGIDPLATHRAQAVRRYFRNRICTVHLDFARAQHGVKAPPHIRVMGWQNGGIGGEQVECQCVRVALQGTQFVAQAVLHGQRELHPAGPTTNDRNSDRAGLPTHPLQQSQPALVELENRLYRHRMLAGTGHLAHLRCRADVDRQAVVTQGWAPAHQNPARRPVDANHLPRHKACSGKHGQPAEVYVDFVVAVVAGHVTRQHAGVRCLRISADQRHPHARHRAHAKAAQHTDMAVSTAHQDDVTQY